MDIPSVTYQLQKMQARHVPVVDRRAFVQESIDALIAAWGDWLTRPPDGWEYDPYLAWAWPSAYGRYQQLLEARRQLRGAR